MTSGPAQGPGKPMDRVLQDGYTIRVEMNIIDK